MATWCWRSSGLMWRNSGVTSRYADSLVSGQAIDEPRLLSWLQQLYPPDTFKRYGNIQIAANVSGAQVYVNPKRVG